jgi:hypothetical protein
MMQHWTSSIESDLPLWVRDLDDDTYGVQHRRLCVWADEFDGRWHWEIQTWDDTGVAGQGVAASRDEAMLLADAAARALAGTRGGAAA